MIYGPNIPSVRNSNTRRFGVQIHVHPVKCALGPSVPRNSDNGAVRYKAVVRVCVRALA
jgi:hypothetical protein